MTIPNKWRVFKSNGVWKVWRPREDWPVTEFDKFPYEWKPDCDLFLTNRCRCRLACAR